MARFIQWNCRSTRSNGHWLRSPPFQNTNILCLQETFLKTQDTFSLPGMQVYRADRPSARGGGLITAVSSTLQSFRILLPPAPFEDIEALGVRIHVHNMWISVINVYIPSGRFPTDWFDVLISNFPAPFMILGDFNINILNTLPPVSSQARIFTDWISTKPLCILNVDSPTRIAPGNSASLLDLTILSPCLYHRSSCSVHPDPFDSDHQPVLISLGNNTPHSHPSPRPVVHWARASAEVNSTLSSFPHSNYVSFSNSCQKAISNNTYPCNSRIKSNPPWWNSTCRQLLGFKRKHLRLARSLCSKEHWCLYKRFAAKLRRYIRTTSRNYWDALCRSSCPNGRIFKILKRLATRNSLPGDNILLNPNPVPSTLDQAQLFLNAFSQTDMLEFLPYDLSGGDSFLDSPFSPEDLHRAINNTHVSTPGADKISITFLKRLSSENMATLLEILNQSFLTGSVPDNWKLATVVPILKPGKPSHTVSSYRPIALTSVCAKVFERMVLYRLIRWVGKQSIFHPFHFGFLPFQDSNRALCTFYSDIVRARESRMYTFAACLDIKAAYDSVWIDGLIYKMASLGITGRMGLWITHFMKDRKIQIRWKAALSQCAPSLKGVPQGCVLSPLLFMFYMADIFDTADSQAHILVYADDIIVYAFGEDATSGLRRLQNTLDNIIQWCRAWKLSISADKCVTINFSRRRASCPPLKIAGRDLPWSPTVKILGVWFSQTLTFTCHFSYLRTKAFKRLNYLKAIAGRSRGISSLHMIHLINSFIRSSLEYASPILINASPSALKTLEVTYNAAIRTATGALKCTPIPVLRREAVVPSITSRFTWLVKKFLLTCLSLPPGSVLGERLRRSLRPTSRETVWTRRVSMLLDLYHVNPSHIIKFSWPPLPPLHTHHSFILDGLPFQIPNLPLSAITSAWRCWLEGAASTTIIATDATKDSAKTAIAAVNVSEGTHFASLIPHVNSVFTAESLAIYIALTCCVSKNGEYILLSDSLSALTALQSINYKSPKVTWLLYTALIHASNRNCKITFVWCPGHKGIPPNEEADHLARNGPYQIGTLNLISPEDLISRIRHDWLMEIEYEWLNSEYYSSFSHLSSDRLFAKWAKRRWDDVTIARWRSRTLATNSRLYRMHLTTTPLCPHCLGIETEEHILLFCPYYNSARSALFGNLQLLHLPTYSDIIESATASRAGVRALSAFSEATLRR